MKKHVALLALLSLVVVCFIAGCGGKSQVTGKVTFSDGTPLTFGTVTFSNDTTICKGEINEEGVYRMRTFKPGDGVPAGTYKIYITDTLQFGDSGKSVKTQSGEGDAVEFQMIGKSTNFIPPQYSNPDESPFGTITVKGKTTKDLVIDVAAPTKE